MENTKIDSYWHDIIVALLSWAVPLVMAWFAARIPIAKRLFVRHRTIVTMALSGLISIGISYNIVALHDRYFKSQLDELTDKINKLQPSIVQLATVSSSLDNLTSQIETAKSEASRITALESKLKPGGNPTPVTATQCPPGTYVVGLNPVGAPGGQRGYLESVTVICKQIQLQQ